MAARETIAIVLLISFALPAVAKLAETSFNFTSFSPLSDSISFQGQAQAIGGSLELNNFSSYSYGRAVYSSPVQIWDNKTGNIASFSTRFSFSILRDPNAPGYSDGLVFFLAPFAYDVYDNTSGGGFTLFDWYGTKAPVVAIGFDTYENQWDYAAPHVGINIGYVKSEVQSPWDPFAGRVNATVGAEIIYDATNRTLRASFSQGNSRRKEISYSFDLRRELPENVTVGFAGSSGSWFERHLIRSWSLSSSLELGGDSMPRRGESTPLREDGTPRRKRKISAAAVVAGGVAGLVLVGMIVVVLSWFIVKRRDGRRKDNGIDVKELEGGKGPKSFSYSELARATKNFAQEEKLGRGGFGDVYRGKLRGPERVVAIKRVAKDSRQGKKEYVAEVKVISRLRHRNLVRLVGWCHERGELLLVYEFMPNGSLDAHLYGDGKPLPWEIRFNIAKGVAAALLYLHEEWEQCVVHRDVKASNVMLDGHFSAKLGDFGLARLVDHGKGMETTAVAGTMGYLAPETTAIGRASTESDVYSFGVLALEIVCGRKPIKYDRNEGQLSLVDWVWGLYSKGSALEAADPKLRGEFDPGEMERLIIVGLWCAHPDYQERPSMAQVIGTLVLDMALPGIPLQQPAKSYAGVSFTGGGLASLKAQMQTASPSTLGTTDGLSIKSI